MITHKRDQSSLRAITKTMGVILIAGLTSTYALQSAIAANTEPLNHKKDTPKLVL